MWGLEITRPLTGQVSVFCYIRLPKISSVLTGFQAPKAETEKEETAEKKEAEEKEEKMEVDEKKEEEPEGKKEKSEEPMETDAEKKTEENPEEKKETEGNVCVCWVVVVRGHAGVWLVSVGCLSSHSVCVALWLSEGMPVSGSFLWAASALTVCVLHCGCQRACRCLARFCGLPQLSQQWIEKQGCWLTYRLAEKEVW